LDSELTDINRLVEQQGKQRKAAMILMRCGAAAFGDNHGSHFFNVKKDAERPGIVRLCVDKIRLEMATDVSFDLKAIRVHPHHALRCTIHCCPLLKYSATSNIRAATGTEASWVCNPKQCSMFEKDVAAADVPII